MVKLFTIAIGILFAVIQISCSSDDDAISECQNTICTLQLVTISVSVIDQNQDPIALDSFKVIDLENGNDMTISLTPSQLTEIQELGNYPIIMDGTLGVNQEKQIQFRGFQNDQEVIRSDYTVGTDCCHVSLISGNLQLTL